MRKLNIRPYSNERLSAKTLARRKQKYEMRDRENFNRWHREWLAKHPDKEREYHLKGHYGITAHDYARMVAEQGGHCACCGGDPQKQGLVVDHCHGTKRVRGLLCTRCNVAIGMLNDDPERAERAAAYLRRNG